MSDPLTTYGRSICLTSPPGAGPYGKLAPLDILLDDVVRRAVARHQMDFANILGRVPENPFPLYYPGMPAYCAARRSSRI